MEEVLEKITKQTKEDLERKPERRVWNTNSQQTTHNWTKWRHQLHSLSRINHNHFNKDKEEQEVSEKIVNSKS